MEFIPYILTFISKKLNVFVTSITRRSLGGFLSTGHQIALDLHEIMEMTC